MVNAKISENLKGKNLGNQHRKGKTAPNKGIPMSESQKIKLRIPKSIEHRIKLSKAKIGTCCKQIVCINTGNKYKSIKDAAYDLNLTVPNVVNVLKGRALKTKGYSFSYL